MGNPIKLMEVSVGSTIDSLALPLIGNFTYKNLQIKFYR